MGILSTVKSAMPTMFRIGAEDATYMPSGGTAIPCKIFIDFGSAEAPPGLEGQFWQQQITIEALLSDEAGVGIGTTIPAKNSSFVFEGTTYRVGKIISSDGLTAKMTVK